MKLCECGCGSPAPIAKKTHAGSGAVKGQPVRFVHGHNRRRHPIDEPVGLRRRRQRYGLEASDIQAMLDRQDGKCANVECGRELDLDNAHVDHDHSSGVVRGVLCAWCNRAAGQALDDPRRLRGLADYLEGRSCA